MRRYWLPMLLSATMLVGCAGTFNQSLDVVDLGKQQAPAAIMLSDAKLYRREALINERNREIAYLDDLLDKSRTIEIKPELLREVEQVAAMSASLGVSFDPAAALNYRRARDVGNLEQEQRLSQLEAAADPELAVLRRDIEIQKLTFELEKLKGQVAAVQKDPAASGGGAAAAQRRHGNLSDIDERRARPNRHNGPHRRAGEGIAGPSGQGRGAPIYRQPQPDRPVS